MWNMFKINNKDTRTYFTSCSSVSIVNFENVNCRLGWQLVLDLNIRFERIFQKKGNSGDLKINNKTKENYSDFWIHENILVWSWLTRVCLKKRLLTAGKKISAVSPALNTDICYWRPNCQKFRLKLDEVSL